MDSKRFAFPGRGNPEQLPAEVKLILENEEIHRWSLHPRIRTFSSFRDAVYDAFPQLRRLGFTTLYLDEEGDMVTIRSVADFALAHSITQAMTSRDGKSPKILRVHIVSKKKTRLGPYVYDDTMLLSPPLRHSRQGGPVYQTIHPLYKPSSHQVRSYEPMKIVPPAVHATKKMQTGYEVLEFTPRCSSDPATSQQRSTSQRSAASSVEDTTTVMDRCYTLFVPPSVKNKAPLNDGQGEEQKKMEDEEDEDETGAESTSEEEEEEEEAEEEKEKEKQGSEGDVRGCSYYEFLPLKANPLDSDGEEEDTEDEEAGVTRSGSARNVVDITNAFYSVFGDDSGPCRYPRMPRKPRSTSTFTSSFPKDSPQVQEPPLTDTLRLLGLDLFTEDELISIIQNYNGDVNAILDTYLPRTFN